MRCGIYIRVSTNMEEQKTSLVNQKDLFVQYVMDKSWDIVDFYVDVDSGTKSKRKNLQRLLNDAEEGKFDIILAKELSRLARNGELSYQIRNLAERNGIHILTLDNAINTLERETVNFGFYACMYENESRNTSNRMKYANKIRAKRGEFIGSIPPYGYYKKDNKLHVKDDFTPDVVRRIFREYLYGKGFDKIAMNLYEEDVPSPGQVAGKSNASDKWHGSSVRLILENRHYVGDLVQGKSEVISVLTDKRNYKENDEHITIENTHKAIISKEDFEAVQQLIKSRRKIRPKQSFHLFTNVLFCEDCKSGMHFKKNRKGYVCGSYNKHGKKACTDHIVREYELKAAVLDDIKLLVSRLEDDKFVKKIQTKLDKHKKKSEKEIKSISKQIESFKSKKKKALGKLIEEIISKDEYDMFTSDINEQMKCLELKRNELEAALRQEQSPSLLKSLEEIKDSVLDLNELTPEILHRFIEKIEIKSDGTPRIHYRFSATSVYF